ncbi:MAG TPA: HNH endonuclease family protein [Bdellovibrio sp.]|uniref:HNH endonuclease family protein n=1 Tax=Bdellovibrio sp. TaxID=28201 RepID=UPI002EE8AB4C
MNFMWGMKTHKKTAMIFAILLLVTAARAQSIEPSGSNEQNPTQGSSASSSSQSQNQPQTQAPAYQQYYTINEQATESVDVPSKRTTGFSMAADLTPAAVMASTKVVIINILKWVLHDEPLTAPQEKYIRKLHFGRWINDPTDDTCMNTRARVLVRDSEVDVTYKGNKQCTVEAGKWHDPYADQDVTEAKGIQIDHLVPLKNAYLSGASDWDYKTRCLYANYTYFTPHLVSAGGHENMSKGDSGPEGYLPPNESYRCEYIRNWLAVKTIWKLKMNPSEVQAIHDAVVKYGCSMNMFQMSQDGLAKQRAFIEDNLNFCIQNKR